MIRRVSLGVLLALATLLGMWYATDNTEPTQANNGLAATKGPDYFMEDFVVSVMDETGRLNYTLAAKHMDHYIKSNTTLMTSPQIKFYQNTNSQWLLRAEKGRIEGVDNEVLLQGEVHITREGSKNHTDVLTTNLYVYPKTKKIKTDDPVQILNPAGNVNAVGLKADFNNDRLQLMSKVKSRYDPGKANP